VWPTAGVDVVATGIMSLLGTEPPSPEAVTLLIDLFRPEYNNNNNK
jgi:hypothetical protein